MAAQNIPANNDQHRENMGLMPVLPPGFRFFPSDEEIFCYYLVNKNDHPKPSPANPFDHNVIKELDVYGNDHNVIKELDAYGNSPLELAEHPYFLYSSGEPARHWYFYTVARGSDERHRRMRTASDGFWLMRGRGNDAIVGGGGEVLGSKSSFVFYMGTSVHNAVRTDWTMHEFALPDHAQASFVLYRLFAKPWTGNSSLSARNDGVLAHEAAPGSNRGDMTSANAVR